MLMVYSQTATLQDIADSWRSRPGLTPTGNPPTVPVYVSSTAAVQKAINDNPGRALWLHGDLTLTSTLTITASQTRLDGDANLTAGFSGGPMVRVLNADYCGVGGGLFFDGNWQSGVAAVELMGAVLGEFHVTGDRLPIGINLDCANAAATQNSALNDLWLTVRNGVKGIVFTGKSGQYASNNRIHDINWWGASSVVATGIDFAAYSDNNTIDHGYLHLGFAGSVGVVYNSQSPASDLEVYENHGRLIVESTVAGTTAVKGNRTWQSVGQWPSFLQLRTSGSQTPIVDIGATSDIVLIDSNLNGTGTTGLRGEEAVFISPAELRNAASATASSNWGAATWNLPAAGTSSLNFQASVPSHWRTYDVTVYWAINDSGAGNVRWQGGYFRLATGTSINDVATATAVTAAAGATQNGTTSTKVVTALANTSPMMWGKVTRLGDDAADTATGVVQVLGVALRRAS